MVAELFTWVVLALLVTLLFLLWKTRKVHGLNHIPGPPGHFLLGNFKQIKPGKGVFHKQVTKFAEQYGPVLKLVFPHGKLIIVSGFPAIYEVCVEKARAVSGRAVDPWRVAYVLKKTGILFSAEPDDTWKNLRKVSHRHLKQFGDGMSRLEWVITDVAEDMFDEFRRQQGKPFDPRETVFDTALKSIAFLITGERPQDGDALIGQMKEYEPLFFRHVVTSPHWTLNLIDLFHWLRHLLPHRWKNVERAIELEHEIWDAVKSRLQEDPEQESLARLLLSHSYTAATNNNDSKEQLFTEDDARRTCMSLLLAGIATTSNSFHAMINFMAHDRQIQDRISQEISAVVPAGRSVSLTDRPSMPYTRATILELLRHFPVVASGVPHRTIEDVTIQGFLIPAKTRVITNLWQLHHEKAFWADPDNFRPERFLDADGNLLPADHPNRKHLMPFGAGMRVCLGESLALARLFLWTAITVQRFQIRPAEDNDSDINLPENFNFKGILSLKPYNVLFSPRY